MANEVIDDVNMQDDYNEEDDDDFNPEANAVENDASTSDGSEAEQKSGTKKRVKKAPASGKRQRVNEDGQAVEEDLDFENSGDEGIIKEGTKEQRRRKRKIKDGEGDEDSGGEGGFVKTRSMRAAADPALTRKSGVLAGKVTADIDAIWARLNSASIEPTSTKPADEDKVSDEAQEADLITIKRTYTFAGTLHTETKVVPRSSAQAQAYLATKDQRAGADVAQAEDKPEEPKGKVGPDGQILSQPKKRFSAWDPNPTGFIKGLPSAPTLAKSNTTGIALKIIDKGHLGPDSELWYRATPELVMKAGRAVLQSSQGPAPLSMSKNLKAQKLNVVDKSKLDWAEHVDATEGAREELEKAKKDKTSYLERKDFLDRVEGKAEDERAKARGVVR